MIGCLIGEVFALEAPTVLLNVNGVGYEIDTPLSTFCQLQKGQKVTLWTHLVVREDAQQLYGFSDTQEKIIFRTLLKVNGVGPKMALGILSTLSIELLIHSIEHYDINTLINWFNISSFLSSSSPNGIFSAPSIFPSISSSIGSRTSIKW